MNSVTREFLTLPATARFYDAVMRLADVYRAKLSLDVLELRLEDLIEDFDTKAREVCDFVGLEWNESMRDFASVAGPAVSPRRAHGRLSAKSTRAAWANGGATRASWSRSYRFLNLGSAASVTPPTDGRRYFPPGVLDAGGVAGGGLSGNVTGGAPWTGIFGNTRPLLFGCSLG